MRYLISVTILILLDLCCYSQSHDSIYIYSNQNNSVIMARLGDGIVYLIPNEEQTYQTPLLAVKSNLLFDLLSLINFELEIPIGSRWSIASELIFPWWRWDSGELDSKRHRIQMVNGNLEGRYWWGDRDSRPMLTGWFTGVYAGGGLYDFERKHKGYQGEFFIVAGVSCGYSHVVNRVESLRLEYSIGVGYLKTNYRYYEANCYYDGRWHAVECSRGNYRWIGPTRAKVSLSWLINRNRSWSL